MHNHNHDGNDLEHHHNHRGNVLYCPADNCGADVINNALGAAFGILHYPAARYIYGPANHNHDHYPGDYLVDPYAPTIKVADLARSNAYGHVHDWQPATQAGSDYCADRGCGARRPAAVGSVPAS